MTGCKFVIAHAAAPLSRATVRAPAAVSKFGLSIHNPASVR